jgi:predicted Zn finger-like uncharacterized protein
MIRINCPQCETKIKVKPELAGRTVLCPKCKGRIQIPPETPIEAEAVEEAPAPPVQPTGMPVIETGARATQAASTQLFGRINKRYLPWIIGAAISLLLILPLCCCCGGLTPIGGSAQYRQGYRDGFEAAAERRKVANLQGTLVMPDEWQSMKTDGATDYERGWNDGVSAGRR